MCAHDTLSPAAGGYYLTCASCGQVWIAATLKTPIGTIFDDVAGVPVPATITDELTGVTSPVTTAPMHDHEWKGPAMAGSWRRG